MTELEPTTGDATVLPDATPVVDRRWADAPCAALTVGADGTVLQANGAARALLPRARTGDLLSRGAPWLATSPAR